MKITVRRVADFGSPGKEIDVDGLLAIEFDFGNGQVLSVGQVALGDGIGVHANGAMNQFVIEPVASNAVRISAKR